MRIVSFNCHGCSTPRTNAQVHEDIQAFSSDLLLLQETNATASTSTSIWWSRWPFTFFHSFSPQLSGTGVAIGYHRRLNHLLPTVSVIDAHAGIFLHVVFRFTTFTLHVFNVHVPQRNDSATDLLTRLNTQLVTLPPEAHFFIGGDFNCTLDANLDRHNAMEYRTSIAAQLQSLVKQHSLHDTFRTLYPTELAYTWYSASHRFPHAAARLDRIYISSSLLPRLTTAAHHAMASSDHHAVEAHLTDASSLPAHRSWTLRTSILQDPVFLNQLETIINHPDFSSIHFPTPLQRWLSLKARLRVFCQTYSHQQRVQMDLVRARHAAELAILPPGSSARSFHEDSLHSLTTTSAREALIRLKYATLYSVDRPTKYFLSLEKQRRSAQFLTALRSSDGTLLTDPASICAATRRHFADFFAQTSFQPVLSPELFQHLEIISPSSVHSLNRPFTLDEVNAACRGLRRGKSPGPDGLPTDLYLALLPHLGPVLLDVYNDMLSTSQVPTIFHTSIIHLLPKKGDLLLLTNWRPISLLNSDYKILARIMSTRLNSFLPQLIHNDQTYAIPGRTIHRNLHILRDLISIATTRNERLALLSLDQTKAFDRVDHSFLSHVLTHMGIVGNFHHLLASLYTDAYFHVRCGASMTSAIPFRRGIRQGCPLSGQLFSIASEPLLSVLRVRLSRLRPATLPATSPHHGIYLSAYADDLTVFVRDESDFDVISDTFRDYAAASNALLNFSKCTGLWCGAWAHRTDNPWNARWSTDGHKYLGVYLGTDPYMATHNWTDLHARLSRILSRWSKVKPFTSFRGRVILCNTIAASVLWHRFKILSPPKVCLSALQRLLVNFVWDKVHWTPATVLTYPLDHGGLSLVSLDNKVQAFRLQQLLYLLTHPSDSLRLISDTIISRHPRRLTLEPLCRMFEYPIHPPHIGAYYSGCLTVWRHLPIHTNFSTCPSAVLDEPLFSNPCLRSPSGRPLHFISFLAAGIITIRHLLSPQLQWKPFSSLSPPLLSSPLNEARLRQLQSTIIHAFPSIFTRRGARFPVGTRSSPPLYTLQVSHRTFRLQFLQPRDFYRLLVRLSASPTPVSLPFVKNPCPVWKPVYHTLNTRRECDIQWRLLHNALPTPEKLARFGLLTTALCRFCGQFGSLIHIYADCPVLQPALQAALHITSLCCTTKHTILDYLSLSFTSVSPRPCVSSSTTAASAIPALASSTSQCSSAPLHSVCMYTFILLKHVIYLFHLHPLQQSPPPALHQAQRHLRAKFLGRFRARLLLEFQANHLHHTSDIFLRVWNPRGQLFCIDEDNLRFDSGIT